MHVFWHLSQLYLVAFHQMDLVVFVHTAYGVEHILDPRTFPSHRCLRLVTVAADQAAAD